MALIADIFLAAGALGAAIYCLVLSRRLARFSDLEKGMGGAIAVLSVQVDDMTKALSKAQGTASTAQTDLDAVSARAEAAAQRLELLLASMHDLPAATTAPVASPPLAPSPPPVAQMHEAAPQPQPQVTAPQPATATPDEAEGAIQWRTRRPVGGAM
ncbi:hypothetical protein [Dinoroseobacter sp. S76]|uniref:hypothetical protein n=1 Tax=Dinoroseobacter sp. S76 TaxID=3415124 RepID=UPI003C7BCA9F